MITTSFHELPPRGRYIAREVGRLAGVSGQTIGQWARRGYIRASQKRAGQLPLLYSFQDVAEAIIVHELLERGSSYRQVRETIRRVRERFGTQWPLSHVGLATTTGGEIIAEADQALYAISNLGWQQVTEHDLTRIVGLLQSGGWAARELRDLHYIEVDPRILSGRPSVRGTRLAAEKVAHIARSPDGARVLTSDYHLSPEQIRDARRWWEATEAYEQVG